MALSIGIYNGSCGLGYLAVVLGQGIDVGGLDLKGEECFYSDTPFRICVQSISRLKKRFPF